MKAEITQENKAKFFAQYWGQCILRVNEYHEFPLMVRDENIRHLYSTGQLVYLDLKPLSSISDEDAISVAEIACPELFHTKKSGHYVDKRQFKNGWITVHHDKNHKSVDIDMDGYVLVCDELEDNTYERNPYMVHSIDYLRSKGYAITWMGLAVEEMVEAGWIKLI